MSDHKSFGLTENPYDVFNKWHEDALAKEENANAFAFASVDGQGKPDVRYLLFKGFQEQGLSFFSHTNSPKGVQLADNCAGAIAFYWHQSGRQVRVRGHVSLLPLEVSQKYFAGRDLQSKLASAVSHQSETIESRSAFESLLKEKQEVWGENITCPDHWRGYTLIPDEWEFFIYGAHRINDRFLYQKSADSWDISRLQP